MKTNDIKDDLRRVVAFTVDNFLLTRMGLYRLVRRIPGCTVTRRPTAFMKWSSEDNDEFCEFELDGVRFVAQEDWGDSSEFWVGPKLENMQTLQWSPAIDRVREAFRLARPIFGLIFGQPCAAGDSSTRADAGLEPPEH